MQAPHPRGAGAGTEVGTGEQPEKEKPFFGDIEHGLKRMPKLVIGDETLMIGVDAMNVSLTPQLEELVKKESG